MLEHSSLLVFLSLLFLGSGVLIMIVSYSIRYGISPMPSHHLVIQKILEQIPTDFEGSIYDLGSGWGHLARSIAKHCPHAQVRGYEISPVPWLISQCFLCPHNLTFMRKDFLKSDLSDAKIVLCYLSPGIMGSLRGILHDIIGRGGVVISHTFALPEHLPLQTWYAADLYHTPIYLYALGGKIEVTHSKI